MTKKQLPIPASKAIRRGTETVYPAQKLSRHVNPDNPRWAGYRPRWVADAERTVRITPEQFMVLRRYVHCMSPEQCAAFLRVDAGAIMRWEAGLEPIPYSAYVALQLSHELQFLPHQIEAWREWEIIGGGDHVGLLLNQRTGETFSPDQLNTFRYVRAEMQRLAREKNALERRLGALEAENTKLRKLFQTDGVTKELHAMQSRLAALLTSINTAEVIDFPADGTASAPALKEVAA